MMKHSQLQIQVLKLYKELLRAGKQTPGVIPQVKYYFRKNASISKQDVLLSERLLRQGVRTLKMLQEGRVSGMGTFKTE